MFGLRCTNLDTVIYQILFQFVAGDGVHGWRSGCSARGNEDTAHGTTRVCKSLNRHRVHCLWCSNRGVGWCWSSLPNAECRLCPFIAKAALSCKLYALSCMNRSCHSGHSDSSSTTTSSSSSSTTSACFAMLIPTFNGYDSLVAHA